MAASRAPLLVYVSGAPGAGKTTLAEKIAQELCIPHIASDRIHGGVRYTQGGHNDRSKSLHDIFVPLLVEMAQKGISFVVDQVLQRNMSEHDIIHVLMPHARLVYVHVYADNPIERHLKRELARHDSGMSLSEEQLIERSEYHRNNMSQTQYPLAIDVPLLEVDATQDYRPLFEQIISFIGQAYGEEEV